MAGPHTADWVVRTAPRASSLLMSVAWGHQRGGTWVLPANVCPVVPLAIASTGSEVEFVDIDPDTLGMDERLLEARLLSSPRPVGVVDVRTYGSADGATRRHRLARRWGGPSLCIVDDRCAGIPAVHADAVWESNADVVLFSTGYGKYVDLGGGGYAFVRPEIAVPEVPDPEVPFSLVEGWYKRAIRDRSPLDREQRIRTTTKWVPSGSGPDWGDYQRRIEDAVRAVSDHKAILNTIYHRMLGHLDVLPPSCHDWRFCLRVTNRDLVLRTIFDAGGFASAHYYPTNGLFGARPAPIAEALGSRILNLFNDHHYTQEMARRTAQAVLDHAEAPHA
ncbi:MAG: DegT/DnrJ/EryC1/StrS family aminotransferase [Actinomycetota bacterium]